jgi:hypothetical protein
MRPGSTVGLHFLDREQGTTGLRVEFVDALIEA